jgi:hypothetical protein
MFQKSLEGKKCNNFVLLSQSWDEFLEPIPSSKTGNNFVLNILKFLTRECGFQRFPPLLEYRGVTAGFN